MYHIGNGCPGLGQTQTSGRMKLVNNFTIRYILKAELFQ